NQRVRFELLLPTCAHYRETGLPEAAGWQGKLAHSGRRREQHPSCVVVKDVDLPLVETLGDHREIQWRVVDAPAEREFCVALAEGQKIAGQTRLNHGALREATPVDPQTGFQNEPLGHRPGVLHVSASLCV